MDNISKSSEMGKYIITVRSIQANFQSVAGVISGWPVVMSRNVVVIVFYCLKLCTVYESNKAEVFNVQLICFPFRLICYSISFPICFRVRKA